MAGSTIITIITSVKYQECDALKTSQTPDRLAPAQKRRRTYIGDAAEIMLSMPSSL